MKHYYNIIAIAVLLALSTQLSFAQNQEGLWSFEAGFSAINIYPVGENNPQGEYFDEFFNLNDHWNLGVYFGVTKELNDNISLTARGTINNISKWGELGEVDESVLVDNLKYYGLDGMVNYSFGTSKLQPYIAVGGGYTWIQEGLFNTFSTKEGVDNLVGAGTVNGSVGAKYWINDNLGLNLQTTYKHAFKDYLAKHWEHNLGVVYKFGTEAVVMEEEVVDTVSNDRDGDGVPDDYDLCPDTAGAANLGGCPDTDGDGIIDKDDLCPTVKGSSAFGGCADTDGDGVPDNKDNCPDVAGTDNGCPVKMENTAISIERKMYFDYKSSKLDLNAKTILNDIADTYKDASKFNISIAGHADNIGGDDYNYNLSVERANAVKDYLISKGLSNATISTEGKGETQPVAPNTSEDGRAENRRSVLTINITSK
jgi:outer membrane protein OmpA-like peptidoglycan-associated protein/outer membrane protein W